ncbi:MAG: flagellar export protein FliJ [Spirochaetaceae bacterium]|nr:flagellar export protein FliJ [Spirochaetaceae bacterium]
MKRFNFELEKILKLRLNREQETEVELGRAVGALSALELRIKTAAEEKTRAAGNRFAKDHGAAEIRSYDLYILRLDQTRNALLEAAAKAELTVEEARKVYLEASRDRKIIDKLKERRQKEYRKTALREEIKMIDDISSGAAARKALTLGV